MYVLFSLFCRKNASSFDQILTSPHLSLFSVSEPETVGIVFPLSLCPSIFMRALIEGFRFDYEYGCNGAVSDATLPLYPRARSAFCRPLFAHQGPPVMYLN